MKKLNLEKIQSILPSKAFARSIIVVAAFVLILLIVTSYFGSSDTFSRTKGMKGLVTDKMTVADLTTHDSNGNGLPDWEESLWGLDPTGDGAKNKELINQKKAANGIKVEEESATPLTDTDKFTQSLLATVLALQQSGNLTPEAVANLAASVGDNVDAHHATYLSFTMDDMHLTPTDDAKAKAAYKTALKKVIDQYIDVGLDTDFSIISEALTNTDEEKLADLTPIARAHTTISKQILALPTPPSAAPYALALVNASSKMGATLAQVQTIYKDAIGGMVGLDDYVQASNASDRASQAMKSYFAQ